MNLKQLNRTAAFLVFFAAFLAYFFTMAPSLSFWDCGEFAACAYRLGITHPPGAPLYLLLGRLFSMLPLSEIGHLFGLTNHAQDIAFRITMISVITSAFSVLFVHLITVRLIMPWVSKPESLYEKLKIIVPSALGALTFAFTYSQWFNAVESEVYAVSTFFTAIVIWLIMVWLEKPDDPHSDVYLLLIAYMIGLAIGLHLLNILALPFIFFIIYTKKYEVTPKSFMQFLGVSLAGVFFVYKVIVFYSIEIPLFFDQFGLGAVSVLALYVLLGYAGYYAIKNHKHNLALISLSTLLIFVGYSTYAMILIRSGMNPNIDMNDPETWQVFSSFLNREQYGQTSLLPRIAPFWDYQINKMYVRYFNWQFFGRPDLYALSIIDHLKSLFGAGTNLLEGTQLDRYGYMAQVWNPRGLYGLPLLAGLIGAYYHLRKDWKTGLATLGLFVATGLAIVVYINNKLPEPRERDYTFVGSFFAYSIWIGIGVYAMADFIERSWNQRGLHKAMVYTMFALMMILIPMNMWVYNKGAASRQGQYLPSDYAYNILNTCEPDAILFTYGDNDTYPLWYAQEVDNVRPDVRIVNLSLIETSWYMKQMKNLEPEYHLEDGSIYKAQKVPISYSDEALEKLQPRPWKTRSFSLDVPADIYWAHWKEIGREVPEDAAKRSIPKMSFEVKPTYADRYLRTRDLLVLDIILANRWKRPIYFAITVNSQNRVGLDRYLKSEGLASKLITISGVDLDIKRTAENALEKYQYRGLDQPGVYYDDTGIKSGSHFRFVFIQLADYIRRHKNTNQGWLKNQIANVLPDLPTTDEKIVRILDEMNARISETVIPYRNYELKLNVGNLYNTAGQKEKFRAILSEVYANAELHAIDIAGQIRLAAAYEYTLKDHEAAIAILEDVLQQDPGNAQAMKWYVQALENNNEISKAVNVLQTNPIDPKTLERLQKKLESSKDSQ